jgi:hypothetical protein
MMVGTRNHWKPFRKQERPIMADVILDQLETGEIDHYYGSKWQPSTLVEGGFEAEEYFAHLGDGGSWLYFTAAPIKASDGTIIGAIETLWDTTENKRAETERQKYTRHGSKRASRPFPRSSRAAPSPPSCLTAIM